MATVPSVWAIPRRFSESDDELVRLGVCQLMEVKQGWDLLVPILPATGPVTENHHAIVRLLRERGKPYPKSYLPGYPEEEKRDHATSPGSQRYTDSEEHFMPPEMRIKAIADILAGIVLRIMKEGDSDVKQRK